MTDLDDENEVSEKVLDKKGLTPKKKIIFAIIALIVIIGIVVAASVSFKKDESQITEKYSVIEMKSADKNNPETALLVLYDLPEINIQIGSQRSDMSNLKIKLNIEISKASDVKRIEALMPKILDILISLSAEISPDDVHNAKELYFLKEELLYRINLIIDPIKAQNLNFKSIEVVRQ